MVIQNRARDRQRRPARAAPAALLRRTGQSADAPITVKPTAPHPLAADIASSLFRGGHGERRADRERGGLLAAMLLGAALAISIMLAPSAAARGAEGGQVCTGPQDPTNSCHPHALQQVPLGDQMPEGCKPSGPGTKACGELTHHLLEASATDGPQSNAASGQPGIAPHSSVSIQAGAQVRGTPPAPRLRAHHRPTDTDAATIEDSAPAATTGGAGDLTTGRP